MDAVLDQLLDLTAPPVEAPPYEPWRSLLSMTVDEFAESGAAVHVMLPKLAEGIWLVSDQRTQAAVVEATRLWDRFIKLPRWMIEEAVRLTLPADQRTVGAFIEAIGGRVIGWRAPDPSKGSSS